MINESSNFWLDLVPLLKRETPPSRAKRGEVMRDAIQPVVECLNCGRNVAIQLMVDG